MWTSFHWIVVLFRNIRMMVADTAISIFHLWLTVPLPNLGILYQSDILPLMSLLLKIYFHILMFYTCYIFIAATNIVPLFTFSFWNWLPFSGDWVEEIVTYFNIWTIDLLLAFMCIFYCAIGLLFLSFTACLIFNFIVPLFLHLYTLFQRCKERKVTNDKLGLQGGLGRTPTSSYTEFCN